jgi:hypothetical protein
MPRVPDERVGVHNRVGLLGGVGGINKQMSTMQETAFLGCMLAVGWVRGRFGAGGKYIWVART